MEQLGVVKKWRQEFFENFRLEGGVKREISKIPDFFRLFICTKKIQFDDNFYIRISFSHVGKDFFMFVLS